MRKTRLIKALFLLTALILFICCSRQPVDVSTEISEANRVFMESFNKGDMAAVAESYTVNAKLYPASSGIIEGRKNIESFWSGAGQMGVKKAALETIKADGYGTTAIEEGKYTLYTEGDIIIDEGKYIVTWEKVDGKWLIDRDIWNTNYPPSENMTILESGNLIGLHTLKTSLKENVAASDFEKFFLEEYKPAAEAALPGVKFFLLKGNRGESQGKYGQIIYFKSLEERDYWIPEPSRLSEEGKAAVKKFQEVEDKLNEMIEFESKYTDWLLL